MTEDDNYVVDAMFTMPDEGSASSSVAGSEDFKMDDGKYNTTDDSIKDQLDDVFSNQPSSLPDVRNLIPLRMVGWIKFLCRV